MRPVRFVELTVGQVNVEWLAIFALIGFTAVNYLLILLALTLFVSILMTVSRSYRDSEMVIWSGAGLSLHAWIKPVLAFAAPLLVVITLMALFLSPWANGKAEEYRRQLDSRDETSQIAPGVFREESWSFGGTRRPIVFFELVGDTVWGATAAMLRQLLGIVTGTLGRGDLDHD